MIAVLLCTLLVGGALVARSDRVRAWLVLAALVAAPVMLVVHIRDSEQLQTLRHHSGLAAVAVVLGAAVLVALATLFARRPQLLPLAVAVTIPFRIPIAVAGSTSNLLLPLYLVVAAGTLAWALPRLRGGAPDGEDGAARRPGGLEWALAAALVLYALQSAYGPGHDRALENVVFFYVPFALLFVLLARLRWTAQTLARTLAVLAGIAVVLAGIGYVEYATRHVLLNPKVIASNQLEDYFRVNSLFFDPNIYGRFLAIVLILVVAWMLWELRTRSVALGAVLCAFLFGGLVLTLSQSSFAALLAGLAVLAALRWSVRWTLLAGGVAVAAAVVAVALGTSAFDGGSRANEATSGRQGLVEGGVRLFGERPLQGWGSGSFAREYRRAEGVSADRATSASHTIPVTVAAEQGIVGFAAYLALLAFALRRPFRRTRGSTAARAGVAAAFVGLVVHTLTYAAFLEDPLTWALLGVGSALAATAAAPRAPAEREPEAA
ncbi:unannotated protein [freshwater metagenome]|uniref:Unannotated protein n=1 Tax=freshwater metagenome TaxID=449393 RepID=A0A6J7H4P9_9ZZZZ|nr:hypothetical protein [Actinomycetota bacterium]